MFENLRKFFSPPESVEDREHQYVYTNFHYFILIVIGIGLVLGLAGLIIVLFGPVQGLSPAVRIVSPVYMLTVSVISLWMVDLLKKGRRAAVTITMTSMLLLAVLLYDLTWNGFSGMEVFFYILPIISAGFIGSISSVIVTAISAVIFAFLTYYLEGIGFYPQVAPGTSSLSSFMVFTAGMVMISIFSLVVTRYLEWTYAAYLHSDDDKNLLDETLKNKELEHSTTLGKMEQEIKSLSRHNNLTDVILEVSRSGMVYSDLNAFLNRTASLISEKLGYYHTGIFLLDEEKEWAVLTAASSAGGQRMLNRGHRLAVGRQGIVGYVTATGNPHFVQSTESDRLHSRTTELPDTRSEAALPIIISSGLIGAVDIQSRREDSFHMAEVERLESVTKEISRAVENILARARIEGELENARRAFGELTHESRARLLRSVKPTYAFRTGSPMLETDKAPRTVHLPLVIRGDEVATIRIEMGEEEDVESEEVQEMIETLREQLTMAIENAGLYQESQLRAANERLIARITTEIRETMDVDQIIQIAAEEVRKSLDLDEVTIRFTPEQLKPRIGN